MVFNLLKRRMKGIIIVIAAAMVLTTLYMSFGGNLFGGSQFQSGPNTILARVNGDPINVYQYQQYLNSLISRYQNYFGNVYGASAESIKYEALDDLIDMTLVLQEAKKAKIKVLPEDIEAEMEATKALFESEDEFKIRLAQFNLTENDLRKQFEENLMLQQIQEKQIEGVEVTEEEIIKAYEKVSVRHILIAPEDLGDDQAWETAKEESLAIIERINNGEDFASLAQEYSDDPGSASSGGNLRQFGWGEMVAPFEQAAFSMSVGQITTEPVRSQFGYHIIEVLEKVEAVGEEYEKEKESIQTRLRQDKEAYVLNGWVQQLKSNAKIEIFDTLLRAHNLLYQQKIDEAIVEYEKAIKENPDNPYPHVFLANIYETMLEAEKGLEQYKLAAEKSVGDPEIYMGLGMSLLNFGEEEDAVEAFMKASEIAPNDYYTQSLVLSQLNQIGREDASAIVEERINSILETYNKISDETTENTADENNEEVITEEDDDTANEG